MYRVSYWTFRQSVSHTAHVAQLVNHAIAPDFLNFSIIACAPAYNHMYATYSYNAEVNRCNSNPVSGLLSSARLLVVAASPNFGCDAFRAPAPSLLAAPFQQLPIAPVHAPQLLVLSKQ